METALNCISDTMLSLRTAYGHCSSKLPILVDIKSIFCSMNDLYV